VYAATEVMQMKRIVWIMLAAAGLAGCGGGDGRGDVAPAEVAQQLFLVRPVGPTGPLLAYEMPAGRERFRLPAGRASADGADFFAAHTHPRRTHIVSYDAHSGVPRRSFNIGGPWTLAAVSPTGDWLAFARRARAETRVQVVDAKTGRVASRLALHGDFEVEAVSADGRSMFLVEHLADGAYRIRLYDLASDLLVAGSLRAKGSDEIMAGYAWGGTATPDGQWLLTLYLSTRRDNAFVHTLNLESKFALCLELPSGEGDPGKLRMYGTALSPDGTRLYAANPALGVLVELDLVRGPMIRTVGTFAPARASGPAQVVVSNDGRSVYFSNGSAVWRHDVAAGTVRRVHASAAGVGALGLSRDGNRLFVAPSDGRPRVVAA
jgi:hypothetical protein